MKRIITSIIIFLCYLNVAGQNKNLDTVSIGFKAKLFTVSEYGISDKNQIIEDINSQKIKFLKTLYDNFLFMEIEFSQPYRLPKNHTRTLRRKCNYYIAFNIPDSRFYKLGGFDSLDINSFFKDLEIREKTIIKDVIESKEVENIDISCLYEYHNMSKEKRDKMEFKCLNNCSKKTETKIINH